MSGPLVGVKSTFKPPPPLFACLVQVLNHGLSLVCLCAYGDEVRRTKSGTKLGFRDSRI